MLKTRISSRLSRRLAGMLTLIITVPMMMMGVGVAHATPYAPVGHTAAGLPIYDLKDTLAPPEYSGVQIDTTNLTRDGITDVDGFNVHLGERYAPNGVVHLTDHDRTLYAQWETIMTTMPATGSRTLAWMLAGGIGVFTIAAGAAGVLMRFKKKEQE